jgi:hypothetical protein
MISLRRILWLAHIVIVSVVASAAAETSLLYAAL